MDSPSRVCRACQTDGSGSGDNSLVEIFEKSSRIAYEIFLISQIKVNKHFSWGHCSNLKELILDYWLQWRRCPCLDLSIMLGGFVGCGEFPEQS